jgi:hypothetical protein
VRLRCAQGWIPAYAGNADQEVRFHSVWCNLNGVMLALVASIPVDGVVGIDCESPRWANRDAWDMPKHDSVGVGGFLEVIAGRRLGQGG